jgi:putative hemolysin
VPKRIGLHSPERIASFIARPMQIISTVASPLVSLLSVSTDVVMRLVGLRASQEPPVTEEEINVMMEQGRQAGVFTDVEQDMVQRIFRLGDRNVSSLMTRRSDIDWLNLDDPWESNRRKLMNSVYSRLSACRGDFDEVIGVSAPKIYSTTF